MKKKLVLFASPFVLFLDLFLFGEMASLLRQPSDGAVTLGVILACVILASNFYLYQYIVSLFDKRIDL